MEAESTSRTLASPRGHAVTFAVPASPQRRTVTTVVPKIDMSALLSPRRGTGISSTPAAPSTEDEMQKPYGFEEFVSPADRRASHIINALIDITALGGDDGVRHLEIRTLHPTSNYYTIRAIEYTVPISLDDLIGFLFTDRGTRKREIEDLYISPSLPTSALLSSWEHKERDALCVPALVAIVPTSAFLQRTTVTRVDAPVNLNGQADLVAQLFPEIVDSQTGTVNVSLYSNNPKSKSDGVVLNSIYAPGPGSMARVECMIRDGSKSPRQRSLPQLSVPLLSDELVASLDSNTWKSPVPRTPATKPEFTEFVRAQLDTVFKYLYIVHVKPGDNHSMIDKPLEFRISRHSSFAPHLPVYTCQAMGYACDITLTDMMRLYLCDPVHIKDVYFDFTCQPQNTTLAPGALTIVFQAETNPARATIVRSSDTMRLLDDGSSTPAPVKLKRLSFQTPEATPVEDTPPVAPRAAFRIQAGAGTKRKVRTAEDADEQRTTTQPAPVATPIRTQDLISNTPTTQEEKEVPPAPLPVHAVPDEQEEPQPPKNESPAQKRVRVTTDNAQPVMAASSSTPTAPEQPKVTLASPRSFGLGSIFRMFSGATVKMNN